MAKIEKGLKGTIVEVSGVEKVGEKMTPKLHFILKVIPYSDFEEREPEYWKIDVIGEEKINRFKALAPEMTDQKGTAEVWVNSSYVVGKDGKPDMYFVNISLHEFKLYENARR